MGTSKIDLTVMDLGRLQELRLKLEDPTNATRSMGELRINATLWPRTQEDKEQVPLLLHLFYLNKCLLQSELSTIIWLPQCTTITHFLYN